jgi:hypothetical protein
LLISASTIDSTEGDVSTAAAAIGAFISFSYVVSGEHLVKFPKIRLKTRAEGAERRGFPRKIGRSNGRLRAARHASYPS